jgi:hypothetical protein
MSATGLSSAGMLVATSTTKAARLAVNGSAMTHTTLRLASLVSISTLSTLGALGCAMEADSPRVEFPASANHVEIQAMDDAVAPRLQSGFAVRARLVVQDDDTWTKLWPALAGTTRPLPQAPDVDFASHAVVVAAMGPRTSSGYSIRIDDAATLYGDIWISVVEQSPGAACTVTDALSSPVAVVLVPQFVGQAQFVERTEQQICD